MPRFPQDYTALQAAADYINSTGGINGHQIDPSKCDDQDEANAAQACATAAVSSNDVAVLGAVQAFQASFQRWEQASCCLLEGADLVPQELGGSTVFDTNSTAAGYYYGMATLAMKLGLKKVTIVQCNIPACEGTAQEAAQELKNLGVTQMHRCLATFSLVNH